MTLERIDRFAATPKLVAHLLAEAGDGRLDTAPPGQWTARTILGHLLDVETYSNRLRFERMVAEESPLFADFDESAWAALRDGFRERKERLLGDLALQRQATVSLLRSLSPGDWERGGSHPARGAFTVSTWLDACLQHDASHVTQLEAVLGETVEEAMRRRSRPGWR